MQVSNSAVWSKYMAAVCKIQSSWSISRTYWLRNLTLLDTGFISTSGQGFRGKSKHHVTLEARATSEQFDIRSTSRRRRKHKVKVNSLRTTNTLLLPWLLDICQDGKADDASLYYASCRTSWLDFVSFVTVLHQIIGAGNTPRMHAILHPSHRNIYDRMLEFCLPEAAKLYAATQVPSAQMEFCWPNFNALTYACISILWKLYSIEL
jgi:hypothetical protein